MHTLSHLAQRLVRSLATATHGAANRGPVGLDSGAVASLATFGCGRQSMYPTMVNTLPWIANGGNPPCLCHIEFVRLHVYMPLAIKLNTYQKVTVRAKLGTTVAGKAHVNGRVQWTRISGGVNLEPSQDGLSCVISATEDPTEALILVKALTVLETPVVAPAPVAPTTPTRVVPVVTPVAAPVAVPVSPTVYRKPLTTVTVAATPNATTGIVPAPVTTQIGFATDLIHVTVADVDAGLLALTADTAVMR